MHATNQACMHAYMEKRQRARLLLELEHDVRLLLELEHHVGLGLKEKPALTPCFDVKIGSAFESHVRRVE